MNANLSYQPASSTRTGTEAEAACTPQERVTRSLIGYGILAGPFYIVVSIIQAVVRDGFDLTRHEWSLLANGSWGWVQIANLVVTGLMVVAAGVGFHRRLTSGIGRSSARLLALYGITLVLAGIFTADPMNGFPAGTPDGPPDAPTIHGVLHIVAGGVGFLALIAATFVLARRFRHEGRPGLAAFSVLTGIAFLTGFAAIASGSTTAATNLAFTATVILMWTWLSVTSAFLYRHGA